MLLFINGCMRDFHQSYTARAAKAYLDGWKEAHPGENIKSLELRKMSLDFLSFEMAEEREKAVREEAWGHPLLQYAKEFAEADEIVIAAPYWDLSFPSLLKIYLERVCVCGITFQYIDNRPSPLCRAKKLTYITASGGYIGENHLGLDYIKALCREFFGIPQVEAISVEGVDIEGADTGAILKEAEERARKMGIAI